MPFFCRHSRIAAKRPARRPGGVAVVAVEGVVVLEPVEAVPVEVLAVAPVEAALEDVPLEEPPQAVRPMQASNRIDRTAAAGLRRRLWVWGMELLCR
jgi:hypothetical protein